MKIVIVGAIAGGQLLPPKLDELFHNLKLHSLGVIPKSDTEHADMPYVIGGLIEDGRKLIGPSPEEFSEERNITYTCST